MQITNQYGEETQVILLVIPEEVQTQGVLSPKQTTDYLRYMSSLYTASRKEGMSNVHLFRLTAGIPLDNWCAAHPSAAAHANIAMQLTSYINRLLPNFATSMYPRGVQV